MISKKIQGTLAACGATFLAASSAAHAQSRTSGELKNQYNPQVFAPFAIKIGAFIPTSGDVRDRVGDVMLMGEAEYTIQNLFFTGGVTAINIGYTERKDLRIIPLTLSEMYRRSLGPESGLTFAKGGLDYYFGLGAGFYFTKFDQGGDNENSKALFGGHAVGGVYLSSGVFLEAKYHLVSRYNDYNISGVQMSFGLRF